MKIDDKKIAFGLTSSFYAFKNTLVEMEKLVSFGGEIIPIMSIGAYTTDTKFGIAKEFVKKIEEITHHKVIRTMQEAENIESDIIVVAPCSRK